MTTLKLGSRGGEVITLQKALNVIQDGVFGPITEEAVKTFQANNNLKIDGVVGPNTWAKLNIQTVNKRTIKEIIIHCSATPEGEDFTVEQIRQWHLARGFNDIGYHYIIYRDGSVHKGRDESLIGAHCTNHNSISIGICYIGGCVSRKEDPKNWSSKAKDTRTQLQKESIIKLLKELKFKYPMAKIYGHRDFAVKSCPSYDARKEYEKL